MSDLSPGRVLPSPQALLERPLLVVALLWLAGVPLVALNPVSHDVVWQLWIGRHLNQGVPLYEWIMEVNPPLWYWMAQPMAWMAERFQLPATVIAAELHWLLAGLSIALCAMLLPDGYGPRQRTLMLMAMLVVPAFIFARDIAQREHLAFIGTLPYALLIARRIEGQRVHWRLALAVGLLVTPGIALKHYFVLIPVMFEALLLWRQRTEWRPLRPETVTLAVGALCYAAAILAFERDYLTEVVPLLSLAYGDFGRHPLRLLMNPLVLALPAAGAYFWQVRRELDAPTIALLLGAGAFTGSYMLQAKGFTYHAAPAASFLLLAIVLHRITRVRAPEPRATVLVAGLLSVALLADVAASGVAYRNVNAAGVDTLLADTQPGDAAMMITVDPTEFWPMVEDRQLLWPLRYFHFWMMPTVYSVAQGGSLPDELADLVRRVRSETIADMRCHPPQVIVEDGVLMQVFQQDEDFAALLAHYRQDREIGEGLDYRRSWRLVKPYDAPGEDCQRLTTRP